MSSISDKIAENIVKNNGVYISEDGGKDPQCWAVFKIKNSNFGHVHCCVVYSEREFERYFIYHDIVEILWSLRKLSVDENGKVKLEF